MPTKNPRLTITLQPSTAAQLSELSRLTGESQSSIIADLLQQTGPVFDRLILVLKAAENAQQELKGRMASDLQNAQAKIEQQLGLVLEGFDTVTGDLLAEVEAVQRRARKGASSRSKRGTGVGNLTPMSNRGVRSDPSEQKQQLTKRGRGVENDPV